MALYDLFVSRDGGAYERWLDDTTATSATFVGEAGRSYRFYSVAADAAGRVRFDVERGGAWLVTTVHMVRSPEPVADWISYWASFRFDQR